MRQYPRIIKTLRHRYVTVTQLKSRVSSNISYLLSGEPKKRQNYPLIKRILRNRFKIIQLLARGGSGDTYLAIDLDLPGQPYCVVKHFYPKHPHPAVIPIAKNLFDREAESLYQLGKNHQQIPTLFAHFHEDGDFYLVQEFIDGYDLTQEIVPGQPLSEEAVLNLLKDILEVLSFVHQHNIIHRDIKPHNIMRRHSDQQIVLIDFGSIKKLGIQGDTLTIAVGTPGYMPTEQAKGKPKLSSDIYAVGMIGIQALTGLKPEELQEDPETGEIIWRDKAQVSDRLADILDKMVRERHNQRYQSAAEALQALIPEFALSQYSAFSAPLENPDDNSLQVYKKFILLLGMGLGIMTSVIVIALIYTFLRTSVSPPNQPTPIHSLKASFIYQLSASGNHSVEQRLLNPNYKYN
ncbi:serine/threonine protein kinase [Tolypothrix sp. FACHB-123]|uniref:serine/threonine-protein kinase n=1 Tax=Tolypothrix sp. FACHB-123 TaxID=2692868 RepID=UPI001686A7F5|nr:serine/threonine-protein kinase [Tolypothrix sp. FACHB-123]MBD2358254.1 serine/threonine protein kinase [Tolypothrix sp. FACHB-123]